MENVSVHSQYPVSLAARHLELWARGEMYPRSKLRYSLNVMRLVV
jgi:hypothetical protein